MIKFRVDCYMLALLQFMPNIFHDDDDDDDDSEDDDMDAKSTMTTHRLEKVKKMILYITIHNSHLFLNFSYY